MSSDQSSADQLLRSGQVAAALTSLQSQVRQNPADPKLRVFLFQLHTILGNWDKALIQLDVAAELDPAATVMAQVCRTILGCEAVRSEVFTGKRLPLVFGEPDEWVGWIIRANELAATGNMSDAKTLRQQALDAAPPVAGNINGTPFEWLADADSRLGPLLEAVIDGRYFWIPMQRITSIELQPPADLRDLVWAPATFGWTNGGTAVGFIPTRYHGSESSEDSAIRMARKTTWQERADGAFVGLGQRVFATDQDEYPLLETRRIVFGS
jgi:type VI secretion system protein ImpE